MNVKRFDVKWWKQIGVLNLGTLLVAVGVYFFKFPNHFAIGGVSGISVVASAFIPNLSTATTNLILNLLLLAIGLIFLGASFSLRTTYVSVVYSLVTLALEKGLPLDAPLTDQPLLELIFAVALPAVGAALLFNVGASSGGTDILAMLLKKYSKLNIGTALIYTDFIVAAGAFFAFDVKTGLFSLLGLFCKAFLVDTVMENLHTYKVFQIVTDNPEPICDYVKNALNHSVTVTSAEGSFSHKEKKLLMVVVNRSQALKLQRFTRITDPNSFITITTTSQIVGKGFSGMSE